MPSRVERGVYEAVFDMCGFVMVSKDELGVGLCRKPTRLLTNMEPVAEMMSKTYKGGHKQVALISGRPSAAAIYIYIYIYIYPRSVVRLWWTVFRCGRDSDRSRSTAP